LRTKSKKKKLTTTKRGGKKKERERGNETKRTFTVVL